MAIEVNGSLGHRSQCALPVFQGEQGSEFIAVQAGQPGKMIHQAGQAAHATACTRQREVQQHRQLHAPDPGFQLDDLTRGQKQVMQTQQLITGIHQQKIVGLHTPVNQLLGELAHIPAEKQLGKPIHHRVDAQCFIHPGGGGPRPATGLQTRQELGGIGAQQHMAHPPRGHRAHQQAGPHRKAGGRRLRHQCIHAARQHFVETVRAQSAQQANWRNGIEPIRSQLIRGCFIGNHVV